MALGGCRGCFVGGSAMSWAGDDYVAGVPAADVDIQNLPLELYIEGCRSGGGRPTMYEVSSGDRLTAEQWKARYNRYLEGQPIAPVPPANSPESRLSPPDRDRLEEAIRGFTPTFKHKNHLRSAVASLLKGEAPNRAEACRRVESLYGPSGARPSDHGLGANRQLYNAVGKVMKAMSTRD